MFISQLLKNAARSSVFYYNVNLQPINKKDYLKKITEYNKAMAHYNPNSESMINYGNPDVIDMKTYEKLIQNKTLIDSIQSNEKN